MPGPAVMDRLLAVVEGARDELMDFAAGTDFVIIPEPFGPGRICVGPKGVYWCDVVAHGRVAHGSMPHAGRSAIDDMAALVEEIRTELAPQLAVRITQMPVVPAASRASTINVNAIHGGQAGDGAQSPCVADRCVATFDRRFTVEERCGSEVELVGSPGTYDQKHFAGIAGIEHCVAYGPGPLEEAHRPDESCAIDDLVEAAQVLAVSIVELVG